MSLLLENSLTLTSNIEKLINKLYEANPNVDEATNTTADISPYQDMLTNVIKRASEKVRFDDFCFMIEATTPSGKVPYSGMRYVGKESAQAIFDETFIFVVPDSSAFTEDGDISTATATGKVLHVEAGKILVQVLTGEFNATDSIDNVAVFSAEKTTITEVYTANSALSVLLEEYADVLTTTDGEDASDLKEIVNIIKVLEYECTTKKLSSAYTIETLSDAIAVYGYKFREELIETLSNVLAKLEQARIFKFMRDNAYLRPNISMTASYGVNGNILGVFSDLYARINQSAGTIKKNSNINGELVVVASSNVYRAIISASPLAEVERKIILPSEINMVEDPYSYTDYLCVALNPKKDKNNSAVIYTPYAFSVEETQDPVDFKEKIMVMSRSDIINNPLATKENVQNKSEMMEVTYVTGYENLNNVF